MASKADSDRKDDEQILVTEESAKLRCRFYESQFPEAGALVMVNVRNIAEMGAYVTLLEYDNIEGMILLSELSRRRIRSINKLIRVNRNEVVMVLRVDREKGYIDLSKRRVDAEDIQKCEDRYKKAKLVHQILRHVADQNNAPLEILYEQIGWPLYRKYKHAYDGFKLVLTESEDIFEGLDISDEVKEMIIQQIHHKLAPHPCKIRADIEVSCYAYDGIDAVREALLLGEQNGVEDCPIKIKLIAPPMYVMTITTLEKEKGIELLAKTIDLISTSITSKNGKLEVKMAPKVVSQKDEHEFEALMHSLTVANEEVDGDTLDEF